MTDREQQIEPAHTDGEDYFVATRRPLHSLLFLVPLIAVYECGVYSLRNLRADDVRNGADVWMRALLTLAGGEPLWLLPLLVVACLLLAQWRGRHAWKVSGSTLLGMLAESVLFACTLVLIGQVAALVCPGGYSAVRPTGQVGLAQVGWARLVGFVGAGLYEEVLFRLCLLTGLVRGLTFAGMPRMYAAGLGIFLTSLAFSIAHYVGPTADTYVFLGFLFRFIAGVLFAVLYCTRGLGVTVGAHASYDVLVGIVLVAV